MPSNISAFRPISDEFGGTVMPAVSPTGECFCRCLNDNRGNRILAKTGVGGQ